jgi:hypothetical protein
MAGCTKDNDVETPDDFTVTVEKNTFSVNDTVRFYLTGDPDVITFYSGEFGKLYGNRARFFEKGVNKLVFQANMNQGKTISDDKLELLLSANLVNYDAAGIAAATWTNLTTRNTKWPKSLSNTFVTSDSIDISDFADADKVNIAFRAVTKKTDTAMQRRFQIQNLTLGNRLADGTYTALFSNFANTGWAQTSIANPTRTWDVGDWNVSNANSLTNSAGVTIRTAYPITFNPGTDSSGTDNNDWLLTSAVNLKTVKADAGVVIKNGAQSQMTAYQAIYKTPGTYLVSFVATNARTKGTAEVVRSITITIHP